MTTKLTTKAEVLEWAQAAGETAYQGTREDAHFEAYDLATAAQLARGQRLLAAWPSLFPAVAHGDEEHRAWLKDKLEAWLADAMDEDGGER